MLLDFEFMTLAQVTEFSHPFGPAVIHGALFTATKSQMEVESGQGKQIIVFLLHWQK
jgi:hypothetical protein